MYGNSTIKKLNGTKSSATSLPFALKDAVSGDIILTSRNEQDLPRVGLDIPEGFEIVGEPVKIQLYTDFQSNDINGLNLADTRALLNEKLIQDPELYFGLGNKNQNWANLQFYRKVPTTVTA